MLRCLIRGGLLSRSVLQTCSPKCVKSHWHSPTFTPPARLHFPERFRTWFLFFNCWGLNYLYLIWHQWCSAMFSSCFADVSVKFILVKEDPLISSTCRFCRVLVAHVAGTLNVKRRTHCIWWDRPPRIRPDGKLWAGNAGSYRYDRMTSGGNGATIEQITLRIQNPNLT